MAEPMTSDDAFELKSVMQQILAQMKDSAEGTTGARDSYSRRTSELIAHEELSRRATAAATTATNNNTASMKSLASTMASFGQKLEKLGASLNKTQNDFGISLASAAKLQVAALKESINSFVKLFTSIDYSQLFSEVGEVASAMGDMATNVAKDFASGKGVANAFTEGGKKIGEVLTKERPGPKPGQVLLPGEIKEATKKFQEQFGVINTEFGAQIAQEAKDRGLSVDQLVEARRVFATTAMGDLNKVAGIQSRFFDQFKAKGMTPKIALEAITKYAELIARNGNRFADSFARAAADAKKIGVDLSKVDQIGDSIISDFEGFLEKSAELGAMGFNLDTNTLAQLAESGDTGALFNELRSQLAATGKDITKLRRSEQLALSGAFGISMSDIQRLAGGTPQANSMEDYAEEGNSLLGKILALMIAGGPLLSVMSSGLGATGAIVGKLIDLIKVFGPAGLLAAVIGGLAGWLRVKGNTEADEVVARTKSYMAHQGGKLTPEQEKELIEDARQAQAKRVGGPTAAAGALAGAAIASRFGIPAPIGAAAGGALGLGFGSTVGYMQGPGIVEGIVRGETDKNATFDSFMRQQTLSAKRQETGAPEASFMEQLRTNFSRQTRTHMGDSLGGTYQVAPDKSNKDVIDYMKSRGMTPGTQIKRAEGGLVTGPGTDKSDSIPARLSNGEFVMNAASTANIGVDALNDLNKNGVSIAKKTADYGPLVSSLFEKGNQFGVKSRGTNATAHLIKFLNEKMGGASMGLERTAFVPRSVDTLFGAVGKTSPKLLKFVAQNAKALPILGSLIGGGFEGYEEYKKSGSLSRAIGKGTFSTVGGIGGSIGGAVAGGIANPITAAAGGMAGSYLMEQAFDKLFGTAKKYHNGGIAKGKSDELPAILQRGEAVISKLQMGGLTKIIGGMNTLSSFGDKFTTGTTGLKDKVSGMFGGNAGKAVAKAQELKAGGTGGLLSMAQNKFGGMFGGNAGKAMSGISNLFTGGGSTTSNLMGMATKIPGIGGLLGKATGLLSGGGLKGMAGSLLGKVGLGSLGGSLLGGPAAMLGSLAAPLLKKIPFIGGAAAALAGGPGKLLGKLGGSALSKIGGLFGKKKGGMDLAGMLPPQMQAMLSGGQPGMEGVNFPAMLAQMMGGQQTQQAPAAPVVVDTKGMEEKLNNFIAALQGIQVHMDGTKVGKLLVNVNDAAAAVGVFGAQSR